MRRRVYSTRDWDVILALTNFKSSSLSELTETKCRDSRVGGRYRTPGAQGECRGLTPIRVECEPLGPVSVPVCRIRHPQFPWQLGQRRRTWDMLDSGISDQILGAENG